MVKFIASVVFLFLLRPHGLTTEKPLFELSFPSFAIQSFQAGVGTLDIDITAGIGPMECNPKYIALGNGFYCWLYIGSELLGKLPLKREKQLTPGDYEVSLLEIPARDTSFCAVSKRGGKIHIESGKTVKLGWIPDEWSHNSSHSRQVQCRPAMVASTTIEDNKDLNIREKRISQVVANLSGNWYAFLSSDAWKPLEIASNNQRLQKPVLIGFSESMGGPREVDSDQLQALKTWYLGLLDEYVTPESESASAKPDVDARGVQSLQAQLDSIKKFRDEKRQWILAFLDSFSLRVGFAVQ